VTPAELPAYLEAIKARVEASVVPVADAMAEAYKDHLTGFTLLESGSHPPVTQTPAPLGRPPALMPGGVNGSLVGSVTRAPAVGGDGVATASVQPNVIYAATQEWGSVHRGNPRMWLWVRYIGPQEVKRRGWVKPIVRIPERPYMRTAVLELMGTGQLSRVAARTFEAVVWGE
jgi:hypothetical protein